jgi:hypothetical protein
MKCASPLCLTSRQPPGSMPLCEEPCWSRYAPCRNSEGRCRVPVRSHFVINNLRPLGLEKSNLSPRMGTASDVAINPILPIIRVPIRKFRHARDLVEPPEIDPCARPDRGGEGMRENFVRRQRDGDRRRAATAWMSIVLASCLLGPSRLRTTRSWFVLCNAYRVKFGRRTLSQSALEKAERPGVVKTPSDALAPQTLLTVSSANFA